MGVAVMMCGSAGLGRAIVRELADDGWDVAVLAREEGRLAATVDEIRERGVRGMSVSVDVVDARGVDAAAARIEDELGPIDLWINGPITAVHGEFLDIDPADFERVTDVTYHGLVNGTRAALSRMIPRDRGQVIQISSALAHRGVPLLSAYSAAKGAGRIFTEAVASELVHRGSRVRISEIDMPALNTPFYSWVKNLLPRPSRPIPIVFQPEVGARVVAAVARRPRRRTWVGEPTVVAIIGNRLSGRFLDRLAGTFGYRVQEARGIEQPMLPPNLYEAVPAEVEVHGAFDDKAVSWSPQTWAVLHRRAATAVGLAAAVAVGAGAIARRRRAR